MPVLVSETVELLEPWRGGVIVDCTVGLGGHAEALLEAGPPLTLVGIDRDGEALDRARRRLQRFGSRVLLHRAEFDTLGDVLPLLGLERVRGVFADLGVSSLQLGSAARGFSFRLQGPLDMRMGAGETTAGDIVNRYPEVDLEKIFREYGEESQARRVARAVVAAREHKPIETTTELASIVARAKSGRRGRIDPATQVFQALRIEVNRELEGLERLLDQVVKLLEEGGKLVVISYHSLEDRIVKNTLRDLARGEVDEITGRTRSESRVIELLTKRPVRPSEAEVAANPRARSARLRAARRI